MASSSSALEIKHKGHLFQVRCQADWDGVNWMIVNIKADPSIHELELPDVIGKFPITHLDLDKTLRLPGVWTLILPDSIYSISLSNLTFPNLQEVKGNQYFTGYGHMILSKDMKTLYYSLSGGNQAEVTVPSFVKTVEDTAFRDTKCRGVTFEAMGVSVEEGAFDGSDYAANHDSLCFGRSFYKLLKDVDQLIIPPEVTKISENAFREHMPTVLVTPFFPKHDAFFYSEKKNVYALEQKLQDIRISDPSLVIPLQDLPNWNYLQGVHVDCDHPRYRSVDGVLFDKVTDTLLYFPIAKKQEEYQVPVGTKAIGRYAFYHQRTLKRIILPDSVTQVEEMAFLGCPKLEHVHLSDSITILPNPNVYHSYGCLSNNAALKTVHLPKNLAYIGRDCFYSTGIETIDLPEGVTHVGDYALYTKKLKSIRLPKSLLTLQKGALYTTPAITAYEGTAFGLLGAINPYFEKDDTRYKYTWHSCLITVLGEDGKRKGEFFIPESINEDGAQLLSAAWDSAGIRYDLYEEAISYTKRMEDKVHMALNIVLQAPEDLAARQEAYVKRNAVLAATYLIDNNLVEDFLLFLSKKCLTEASVGKLLEMCNARGQAAYAAYLMDYKEKQYGKKNNSAFRL